MSDLEITRLLFAEACRRMNAKRDKIVRHTPIERERIEIHFRRKH